MQLITSPTVRLNTFRSKLKVFCFAIVFYKSTGKTERVSFDIKAPSLMRH